MYDVNFKYSHIKHDFYINFTSPLCINVLVYA